MFLAERNIYAAETKGDYFQILLWIDVSAVVFDSNAIRSFGIPSILKTAFFSHSVFDGSHNTNSLLQRSVHSVDILPGCNCGGSSLVEKRN